MRELKTYKEAIVLAKQILHRPTEETMEDVARIIRFLADQETDNTAKLCETIAEMSLEIERLKAEIEEESLQQRADAERAEYYDKED
jgi:hypothetical protein